jgi:hypothetical protein
MNQPETEQASRTEGENGEAPLPRYYVALELAEARRRSLASMIANRRCYTHQQGDDQDPLKATDAQPFIEQIAEHCSQTPDYLLPDMPLKEAIFRVILANANRPMTAEELSEMLSKQWAMTTYPRDISPGVIQRLLDSSQFYCIAQAHKEGPGTGD